MVASKSQDIEKKFQFFVFCKKTIPSAEIFNILFWKDSSQHWLMRCVQTLWNLADGNR